MTRPSSDAKPEQERVAVTGDRPPRTARRPRWPMVLCGVLVVAAIAVALFVAYDNGVSTRGPAVDAAVTYVSDVRDQRYAAAYALLAPDLRHAESEQSFAASMRAIDAIDGHITAVSAVTQQLSGGTTVVQVSITRSGRGTFTAHVAVEQAGGGWFVTGADDL